MRILMIEDDIELCSILRIEMEKNQFFLDCCHRGDDADFYINSNAYDVIILDRMLPGKDGIHILKDLRSHNRSTPVILLTAMNTLSNRVEGLDCGADDYLTKPFEIDELFARIRALARRSTKLENSNIFTYGDITLDTTNLLLKKEDEQCTLSKRESDLLVFFIRNKENTLERELLLTRVWGADSFVTDGNLDNFIHFLRKRLKTVHSAVSIKTIRGVGYRLEDCSC
ncbi:response regulator transcription factor [Anaerosporobacter faecicola]|uniref:response regulator transcription factor n=1 Tax=Anaerosporobacter faecicola TaxID=2718714 RepID=UPI00143BAF29|nr:response regulator transcription factor [Anaerosporobacter faecicola]